MAYFRRLGIPYEASAIIGYVLWALAAIADPRAYAAVQAWFLPRLAKLERDPAAASRGNVVFAVAYLEQTQHYSDAGELLERFRMVAPQLRDLHPELATFTRTFSGWKNGPPIREGSQSPR